MFMKTGNRIRIIIFILILALPSVIWGVILLASDREEIENQYEAMENKENRTLAKWPEDSDISSYTSQVEAYYNDRVPFRAHILSASEKVNDTLESTYRDSIRPALISLFYGGSGQDILDIPDLASLNEEDDTSVINPPEDDNLNAVEIIETDSEEHEYAEIYREDATCEEEGLVRYECKDCGETYEEVIPPTGHNDELIEETEGSYMAYGHKLYRCSICGRKRWTDIEPKLVDTSYYPLTVENNYTVMGRFDWLFYRGDGSLQYYTGENVMSEDEMGGHLDQMQKLQDICRDKGINLVYMFMPNKEQVYAEYMPTMEIVTDKKRMDVFKEYADENYDINMIYPIKELKENKVYYDTYFAYDTHWNNVGAFIGTMALYEALGMETTDLAHVETESTDFVALGLVLTGALPVDKYSNDHDQVVSYKPNIELTWEEGTRNPVFGYTEVYRCKTTSSNEEKCVFIGDSFREWMIPYLEKDFADLCMVQRENLEDVAEDIREADVLVVSAVERFDSDLYNRIPSLIDILSND